jgi:ATP-dependent DNA ligase
MQAHAMRKVSNCPDHPLAKRSRAAPQGDNPLPSFIPPQLALLRREAPSGSQWVHEIKLDGYRMHARIDDGRVQLLTRTGLDWTERYRAKEQSLGKLPVDRAYLVD